LILKLYTLACLTVIHHWAETMSGKSLKMFEFHKTMKINVWMDSLSR